MPTLYFAFHRTWNSVACRLQFASDSWFFPSSEEAVEKQESVAVTALQGNFHCLILGRFASQQGPSILNIFIALMFSAIDFIVILTEALCS